MYYKHLSKSERRTLDIMKRKGDSGRKIAHYLGRSVSTLRREWLAAYRYHQAHARSVWRQLSETPLSYSDGRN